MILHVVYKESYLFVGMMCSYRHTLKNNYFGLGTINIESAISHTPKEV